MVRRQVQDAPAHGLDGLTDADRAMSAEVVEHNDVASVQ